MDNIVETLGNGLRKITTYWENGNLRAVYIMDDNGIKQGFSKDYYDNGNPRWECVLKDGRENGPYRWWGTDGHLREEGEYYEGPKGGRFHRGPFKSYHENGALESKCTYNKHGHLEGLYEKYYDNGQLSEKCTYNDGKEYGPYECYYENGQLRWKGIYKNGKCEGLVEVYDENGELEKKLFLKDDEIVEDRLNPERKGLNNILKSLDKVMEPTFARRQVKKDVITEYRKTHPKNGGR